MFIDISLIQSSPTSFVHLTTLQCDNFIPLSFLPSCLHDCEFKCTTYLIPGLSSRNVDQGRLENGDYSYHLNKVSDVIILREFIIQKSNNLISPNFVDTGVNAKSVNIQMIFRFEKVTNQSVEVIFTPDSDQKPFKIEGKSTNSDGILNLILPRDGVFNISIPGTVS